MPKHNHVENAKLRSPYRLFYNVVTWEQRVEEPETEQSVLQTLDCCNLIHVRELLAFWLWSCCSIWKCMMSLYHANHSKRPLVFMLAKGLTKCTWRAEFIATLTLFSHRRALFMLVNSNSG